MLFKYSATCSRTSIHQLGAPWRCSSGDQMLAGPGQQGLQCECLPGSLGPLVLGRADMCGTGPTRDMHPSGTSARGQAILGHSMAPNDNTEATESKEVIFPFPKPCAFWLWSLQRRLYWKTELVFHPFIGFSLLIVFLMITNVPLTLLLPYK